MEPFRYDVFISYRRADGAGFANRLRRKLLRAHKELPVTRAPLKVYLDRVYSRATEDFYRDEINPALLSARWLLVLATPKAEERPAETVDWIRREIRDFTQHSGLSNVRIIHARGRILPRLPDNIQDKMPNAQQIDLRGLTDFYVSATSREDWLGLLATLFDIPPEEMPALRRIDERARYNRISMAAGVAAGTVVFAVGVSGFALYRDAETRRLLDLSAATLGLSLGSNPAENTRTCDALAELWESGGEIRAMPYVRCIIARSESTFSQTKNAVVAAEAMGTWTNIETDLPTPVPELELERDTARFLFEYQLLDYECAAVTGQRLNRVEVDAGNFSIHEKALDLSMRAIAGNPEIPDAFSALRDLLWPILAYIEREKRYTESVDLMERAAAALRPAFAFLAATDDPGRSIYAEYGALRRRIAYFQLSQLGKLEAAYGSAAEAVSIFDTLTPRTAAELFQGSLAQQVLGEVATAQGRPAVEHLEDSLSGFQKIISNFEVNDEFRREVDNQIAYLEILLKKQR